MKNFVVLMVLLVGFALTGHAQAPAAAKTDPPKVEVKVSELDALKYKNISLQRDKIVAEYNGLKQLNDAQFAASKEVQQLQKEIDDLNAAFKLLNDEVTKNYKLDPTKVRFDLDKGAFVELPAPPPVKQ